LDVAPPSPKPPEFHRYRLALGLAVAAPVGLLAILISASIVVDLFFSHRVTGARAPTAADLVACNGAVRALLDGLVRETAMLETEALAGDHDTGAEWDAFSVSWQRDWEQTGARCGFGELEGTGKGAGYDRMAWVHRNLPTTRLKYRDLLAHFARDVGVDLAEMREALDRSLTDLNRAPGLGKNP
jgi:hypothetical protein